MKIRLSVALTRDVHDRLERLRIATDASSMAEVMRRAFAVYEYLVDQIGQGATIISRKDGQDREIIIIP